MWSCCPSALSPDVGPRVESEAGEPASPNAPAVPTSAAVAITEKFSSKHKGTNKVAIIGTVENELPMPMVINKPTNKITAAAMGLLPSKMAALLWTRLATCPVSFITAAISLFAVAMGAGAAGALNMWYESDLDALMTRTCLRPIPTGKVQKNQALWFGVCRLYTYDAAAISSA